MTAISQDPLKFAVCLVEFGDMHQHVVTPNKINAAIRQRQRFGDSEFEADTTAYVWMHLGTCS